MTNIKSTELEIGSDWVKSNRADTLFFYLSLCENVQTTAVFSHSVSFIVSGPKFDFNLYQAIVRGAGCTKYEQLSTEEFMRLFDNRFMYPRCCRHSLFLSSFPQCIHLDGGREIGKGCFVSSVGLKRLNGEMYNSFLYCCIFKPAS